MAPKRKAAEIEDPFLDDSGTLSCQPQNGYLVLVGVNLSSLKKLVRLRVGESAEDAVRRWLSENPAKAAELLEAAARATTELNTHATEGDTSQSPRRV